jgi:hypothetical protein
MLLVLLDALSQSWIGGSSRSLILVFVTAYVNKFVIRFRLVPTFGRGTIRRFANNASEMKRMAARNFEDLLQVRVSNIERL